MDVAASEFYTGVEDHQYDLNFKSRESSGKGKVSPEALMNEYIDFIRFCEGKSEIMSIEDPFDQGMNTCICIRVILHYIRHIDDWESWSKFTNKVGEDIQIVGDDLTVTNPKRVRIAIETKACNALLLKVNQIGTVTESIEAVAMAKEAGWAVMTSHRSGETEDTFISDLAVGLSTGQIKAGAPCRSERLAKYNQLLRIEEQMGNTARFAGSNLRNTSWLGTYNISR